MLAQPTGLFDSHTVLFRTLSSLSEAQADLIEAALPSLAGRWCLERHESCEGNLLLVLMPVGGDDMTACFAVDRDAAGLNLGVLRGDQPIFQSRHDTMETLIPALRRLASLETASMRGSACFEITSDNTAVGSAVR